MATNDYNARIIDEFRGNAGEVGGDFAGTPLLLLHTTGAKSGRERIHPLAYVREGERLYVFGSRGGHPQNPGWFYNLQAHPDVVVEVGDEVYPARATPLEGDERDRVFSEQASRAPVFAEYAQRAGRVIPVVALERASD